MAKPGDVEATQRDLQQRSPASLRRILGAAMSAVAVLTLLLATFLVLITNLFHRASDDMASSVEGVRLSEEATIDLLLLDRTVDPLARRDVKVTLRRRLEQLRPHSTSEREASLLAEARQSARRYFEQLSAADAPRATRERDELYEALGALISINTTQAAELRRRLARWDLFANVVGTAIAIAVLGLLALLGVWFRRQTLEPLLSLAEVMRRFGRGDVDARAASSGPLELRDMADRFNEMADALAHQRRDQIAFLGGVAHDLKTPLSALRISTALFRKGAPLPPEERLRETLALVDRQVNHLDRMVGDLLDRISVQSGDLQLKLERVDVRSLAHDVAALYRDTTRRHTIDLTAPPSEVSLRCDPVRVSQVLTNLVSNAAKYSPAGGRIGIEVAASDEEVILAVSDEGIGISAEQRAHLFEPFRRVGRLRDEVPGTGLGLFVVRRIVEAHGGRIDVDSVLGQGSRFEIRLPREEGPPGS